LLIASWAFSNCLLSFSGCLLGFFRLLVGSVDCPFPSHFNRHLLEVSDSGCLLQLQAENDGRTSILILTIIGLFLTSPKSICYFLQFSILTVTFSVLGLIFGQSNDLIFGQKIR